MSRLGSLEAGRRGHVDSQFTLYDNDEDDDDDDAASASSLGSLSDDDEESDANDILAVIRGKIRREEAQWREEEEERERNEGVSGRGSGGRVGGGGDKENEREVGGAAPRKPAPPGPRPRLGHRQQARQTGQPGGGEPTYVPAAPVVGHAGKPPTPPVGLPPISRPGSRGSTVSAGRGGPRGVIRSKAGLAVAGGNGGAEMATAPTASSKSEGQRPGMSARAAALMCEVEALESMLADDSTFRAPAPPRPEWEAMASRAADEAGAVERRGCALRTRVSSVRERVDHLQGSSDLLREIEAMTAELGERTASFGRELTEVAKLNDVHISDEDHEK